MGPISARHIDPAVTPAFRVRREIDTAPVPFHLGGQAAGALVGAPVVFVLAKGQPGGFDAAPGTFAANLRGRSAGSPTTAPWR